MSLAAHLGFDCLVNMIHDAVANFMDYVGLDMTDVEQKIRVIVVDFSILMLGVAGIENGLENARLTADFLNQIRPSLIWVGTLAIFEDTALHTDMEQGAFIPATELEILEEEKALIDAIELENVRFYGVHPTNSVRVSGWLPQDKKYSRQV